MNSVPDFYVSAGLDALPADARALFGAGFFDTEAWYATTCSAALPAGAKPMFVVVSEAGVPQVVLPMRLDGRRLASLTTPYTGLWRPLARADLSQAAWHRVGDLFGRYCRGWSTVRLDALDPIDPLYAPLLSGLRAAGVVPLPFDHFGNWYCDVARMDWSDYLADRPGALRQSIRRRTRRLLAEGVTFRIVRGGEGLEGAIAAYEAVYAQSWKEPEPFPAFSSVLIRACAAAGTLRLGLLEQPGVGLAAQIWMVRDGWAAVLKLAHDERAKARAPGTVLTGMMIRELLEQETITEIDFGRGDDAYKKDWTGARRQRTGLVLANPWRPAGALAVARYWARQKIQEGQGSALDPLGTGPQTPLALRGFS
jgi:hypothetical protein